MVWCRGLVAEQMVRTFPPPPHPGPEDEGAVVEGGPGRTGEAQGAAQRISIIEPDVPHQGATRVSVGVRLGAGPRTPTVGRRLPHVDRSGSLPAPVSENSEEGIHEVGEASIGEISPVGDDVESEALPRYKHHGRPGRGSGSFRHAHQLEGVY